VLNVPSLPFPSVACASAELRSRELPQFAHDFRAVPELTFALFGPVASTDPTNVQNLLSTAVTVYIEHAVKALRRQGHYIPDDLLPHIAPLGWEHINLTGDYIWKALIASKKISLRTLRLAPEYLEAA
jgi:hypothetical protein